MEREGNQNLGLPHHNITDALDGEGQALKTDKHPVLLFNIKSNG